MTPRPDIVSLAAWQASLREIRRQEKAVTRAHDALAATRRRAPMVRIEKDYLFIGAEGSARILDLFEGRRQLIIYHFMFAPGVHGWPDAGCVGCSFFADQIGDLSHLHARDTSFAMVSRAPFENIQPYKDRMGWKSPWYSSAPSDFNADFGVTTTKSESFGLSVLFRDNDDVFRTYFTTGRGVEMLGSPWSLLDLTPYGRQENWEDSPHDWPRTPPYEWWRRHDEYATRD